MLTDTEIKKKGLKVLVENMGDVDAETSMDRRTQ